MLSVRQLQEWAALQLHEDYTDTAITTLVLRWANEGLQEVASVESWQWLEAQREIVYGTHGAGANTANGITYLPHYIHKLVSVWPGGRNYRQQVQIIGGWELDAIDPSIRAGAPADYLALWGYYGVARDNPTAGVITVADAGASAVSVHIEGVDTNGFEAEETVTLVAGAGVSTTQFAAGPDGVRRCYIQENTVTAGTPTIVTFSSGGTVIETLNFTNGEFKHEHLRTELSPAPNATGETYLTRYLKRIRPVTSEDDIIDIPFEFENLLTHAIDRRLAAFRGEDQKALIYEQMFRQRVKELRAQQNRQPGRLSGMREINSPFR
jgi:hypothetical protein